MDPFREAFRRPPTPGRACLNYTDSHPGQISDRASIRCRQHRLVTGGQRPDENDVPGLHNAEGARRVVRLELYSDDLPRDAIELAAARDALLIG
jgi:hypothetical protein